MHKDVCLINITVSFFYQCLERKLALTFPFLFWLFMFEKHEISFVAPLEAKTFQ